MSPAARAASRTSNGSPGTAAPPLRGGFAEASRSLLRESVLDAVAALLSDRRWEDVTMAAIAERAGVSRQTLYNEFGSRRELAQLYVMREADRFLEEVRGAVLDHAPDARASLTAALGVFLAAAQEHPVLRAVTSADDGDELLALVTTRGAPLLAELTDQLANLLVETWKGLDLDDARELCETLVRLALSHATLATQPPAQAARSIANVLGPHVDELIARISA